MLDGIVVDIINASFKIFIVPNDMVPIPALPHWTLRSAKEPKPIGEHAF